MRAILHARRAQRQMRHAIARTSGTDARSRGAASKAETVNLADNGVARNLTETTGNLARAKAVRPKFFQELNTLFSPPHLYLLISLQA
jgi:hypothetical protein